MQSSRETAVAAVKKEQKATALVSELTTMLKEQKTKISELNRNKQEAVTSLKVCPIPGRTKYLEPDPSK